MTENYRYKAFISYSHRDKAAGNRLLKDLENYRVPKRLVGKAAANGVLIPSRIGHIFRDRDELPAAEDLTAEVKKALTQSEFMIVLCTPAAAASRWVNREIIEFKKLTGERRILSVILSGEPFATNEGAPEEECLPPALRFKLGKNGTLTSTPAEPLAADFRAAGDGARRGLLKLVAGLLGIGLDALIERDLQRKMRRVMAVTAVSIAAMIGMASLTYEAVTARQDAERHRGEAEGLIEFMLTDLRDKLEPVGRLDVLDAVGEKAVDYYDRQALDDMPDDALGRRARAFHLLGEIDDKQGKLLDVRDKFEAAYMATKMLLVQDPENPQRIFDHSQSAFWIGHARRRNGDYDKALKSIIEYSALSEKLVAIENNTNWILEKAYAESNLGTLYLLHFNNIEKALHHFQQSMQFFRFLQKQDGDDKYITWEIAGTHAWIADVHLHSDNLITAAKHRKQQLRILRSLLARDPENRRYQQGLAGAYLGYGRIEKRQSNWTEAVNLFQKSADKYEGLSLLDPENVKLYKLVAISHTFLSDVLIKIDQFDTAVSKLQVADKASKTYMELDTLSEQHRLELNTWPRLVKTKLKLALNRHTYTPSIKMSFLQELNELPSHGRTQHLGIPLRDEFDATFKSFDHFNIETQEK